MNLKGIIQSAENSENDLYFKKKKEKYFKIYKRDTRRLQLCCRREPESCNYSIRCNLVTANGIVQIQEENQIHSCRLRFLSKKSKIADSDFKSSLTNVLSKGKISHLVSPISHFRIAVVL